MEVEYGKFYFIKDNFFDLFRDYKLMENKENGNKRPCYFCFKDSEDDEIIWFVPISSKVSKYKKIYETKKKTRKTIYNFVFGNVLGKEKAFLIQNIFPTTKSYVENKYQNKMQDVEITEKLKEEIIQTSKNVIKLAKKGINIPFYDIIEMKKILLDMEHKKKDLTLDVLNYKLNIRAAGIIIHNDKVLVHRNVNSDHYALVGGRVEIGEDSVTTLKREIQEEMGKEIEITGYISTIENFFEMKGSKFHEIMFVHKAEFIDEEDKKVENTIKNIEGEDYLQYEWIEIDKIEDYPIVPKVIKEILKGNILPVHRINNDL